MKHRIVSLLCCLPLLLLAPAASAVPTNLPDFTALVEAHGAAVVNISTTAAPLAATHPFPGLDEDDPMFDFFRRFIPRAPGAPRGGGEREARGMGSGFVLSADGYILTNAHVVEGAEETRVRLADKREFVAKVVGSDRRTDVALIKIEADDLPVVRLGNPEQLKVGEWVVAIGSPFGFEHSVTAGIVSAKGRSLPQENFVPFIQTDVAINPGNSGGPLFNMRGEVVGINSQIYSRTGGFMGLSFAIPIDVAMSIQAQLREHGRVQRGRIGVVIQDVTRDLAESFGLASTDGALVASVEDGSPAAQGGIVQGDVITAFDGHIVASSGDLPRIVGGTLPSKEVVVEVQRGGSAHTLQLTVGELSDDEGSRASVPLRAPSNPNRLGLVVREFTAAERREAERKGIVIEVARGAAARAELQNGDVILALVVSGRQLPIQDVEGFNQAISGLQTGQSLTLLIQRGEFANFVSLRVEE